jgi:hypothetical protein
MDLLTELHPQALRIAALFRARGEKIAVADGATGGLIAATLLTVPGALDFFVGGGVVYSLRGRDVLFALPREAYKGMRGASEDYAMLQARAIAANFGADHLNDILSNWPDSAYRIPVQASEGLFASNASATLTAMANRITDIESALHYPAYKGSNGWLISGKDGACRLWTCRTALMST